MSGRQTDAARLLARTDTSGGADACWSISGGRRRGYGTATVDGQDMAAHRAAYLLFVGPIPDGFDVDHECHDATCETVVSGAPAETCPHRSCINPRHLAAVPHRANMLRGATTVPGKHAAKRTCPHGHDYATHGFVNVNGSRQCRICDRDRSRRRTDDQRARYNAARRAKRAVDR